MSDREELIALRRLAELEAKAARGAAGKSAPQGDLAAPEPSSSGALSMLKNAASLVSPAWFAAELGRDPKRLGNLVAGGVRGAGSIGATILKPLDMLAHAAGVENDFIGRKDRYSDMTNALQMAGADVNSGEFKAGKLGAEIAGTAGAGGLAANTFRAVAPSLAARAPALLTAIESGGMSAGQATPGVGGAVSNALARSAGGAINGGLSAGLVNPEDAAAGAAVGAAFPNALRAVGAGSRLVGGAIRGVVEPFTQAGRQAIAGRTMARFGILPDDVAGLSSSPTITGARLNLAEQIRRTEGAAAAARLQDAIGSLDPQISARIAAREVENNAARVNRLRELAGENGGRAFAAAERAGTSGPMYQEAFGVDPGAIDIPQRELRSLLRTPALREAAAKARTNAANAGRNVGDSNASGSVEGLHQMKMALDDMISKAESKATGAAQNEADGLRAAQRRLVGFIESISPEYANARGVYRQMSRPINQMDVAGELLKRGTSSTTDLAGNPRLMPNALTGAIRDEGRLIQRATGRNLDTSLEQLFDPEQFRTVRAIADEVDRGAAVARAANGPGSATAQRLASTNLLQQMGVPETALNNPLVQTIMRPVQFGAQLAEPQIQQLLLEITQNPAMAESVMRRATPAQRAQIQRLISEAGGAASRVAPLTVNDR